MAAAARHGGIGRGAPDARARAMLVLALGLVMALLAGLPTEAPAQGIDVERYLSIGQGGDSGEDALGDERAQSRPATGDQSRPAASGPPRMPSFDDYARLAGNAGNARSGAITGPGAFLVSAEDSLRIFRSRLFAIGARIPDAFDELGTTLRAASPTGDAMHFLGIAIFAALLLAVGNAVTMLYAAFIARPVFVRMQRGPATGYAGKLPVLAFRMLLTVIGIAISLVVASAVGLFFYQENSAVLLTVLTVFAVYAAMMLVHTFWRMTLAPFLAPFRIPRLTDAEARGLYRWAVAVSALGVVSTAFCYWISGLGLPREVHVLVTAVLTLATVLALVAAIRANRQCITKMILGRDDAGGQLTWIQRAAAVSWAPLAVIYLLFTWADLAFRLVLGVQVGPERLLVPFLFVAGCMVIFAVIMYAVERIFARQRLMREINEAAAERRAEAAEADRAREEALRAATHFGDSGDIDGDGSEEGGGSPTRAPGGPEAPGTGGGAGGTDHAGSPSSSGAQTTAARGPGMRTFEDLARRVASLVAIGVGAYGLVWYWGGRAVFDESAFFGIVEDLIDIALVGYIAFHAARIWLDRKIAEEVGDEDPGAAIMEGEGGGTGTTRLATLLPLLRNFILVVIAVTVTLVVAMEVGVNVAPLFAGAGVVGLAIGFGAQTLVRDIISGAFFLLDDAFRKGEYIDVGTVKGTVEKISLRSFQLRHHLGMLHTIPFGEIQYLTNFSRDWVMMKLPLRLTYDTDVERVRKLVKKLGQQLLEDETVGHLFLQPLKSQGVIQMEDSAMIVRVKFMTRPGDQWVVRKRVYQEIRDLFDREGIKFAHREVTVRIPDLDKGKGDLSETERQAVGAATRANLDVIEDQQRRPTGTEGAGAYDDR